MGYWTSSRVGGGQWRRVWVTDEQEADEKASAAELHRIIVESVERAKAKMADD